MIVDNSILAATATCSTKAALRYALGLTAEEPEQMRPLGAGIAVHAALDVFFRQGGDQQAALDELTKQYGVELLAQAPEDDRLGYANVSACLGHWLRTVAPALPFRVAVGDTELAFRVPLAPGVDFTGRIDALAEATEGGWWVVDWKT